MFSDVETNIGCVCVFGDERSAASHKTGECEWHVGDGVYIYICMIKPGGVRECVCVCFFAMNFGFFFFFGRNEQ